MYIFFDETTEFTSNYCVSKNSVSTTKGSQGNTIQTISKKALKFFLDDGFGILTPVKGQRTPSIPWTKTEDAKLRQFVLSQLGKNGTKWIDVERILPGRTRGQAYQRWHRVINPDINRERWSTEEERKLLGLVRDSQILLGSISWTRVANKLETGRTNIQCRHHYYYLMSKRL